MPLRTRRASRYQICNESIGARTHYSLRSCQSDVSARRTPRLCARDQAGTRMLSTRGSREESGSPLSHHRQQITNVQSAHKGLRKQHCTAIHSARGARAQGATAGSLARPCSLPRLPARPWLEGGVFHGTTRRVYPLGGNRSNWCDAIIAPIPQSAPSSGWNTTTPNTSCVLNSKRSGPVIAS